MFKLNFCYSLFMFAFINLTHAATQEYLDWHQRPQVVKEQIDNVFNNLHEFSEWGYNGEPNDSFSIDSDKLIQSLAQEKKEGEVIVLDIGAGNGSWSKERAKKIVTNPNFPASITVHFYNLIGERGFLCDFNMKVTPPVTEKIGSN